MQICGKFFETSVESWDDTENIIFILSTFKKL